MVRMKMRVGVFASALCLCLGASVFAGLVDTEVAGITDGQQLNRLFVGEKNPYRRLAYFNELSTVLQRFKLTGQEAWVDQMIDKALDDPWEDVVFAALRSVSAMNKSQFTDKLIALYSSASSGSLALSESPVRCMVIRSLKVFPGTAVSSFLTSVLKDPPRQDQTGEIVREALYAMKESGNQVFVESLTGYSKSLQDKKQGLERERDALPNPAGKAEEKSINDRMSIYNRHIQKCSEMISLSDGIANSLSSNKGGAR